MLSNKLNKKHKKEIIRIKIGGSGKNIYKYMKNNVKNRGKLLYLQNN